MAQFYEILMDIATAGDDERLGVIEYRGFERLTHLLAAKRITKEEFEDAVDRLDAAAESRIAEIVGGH